MAICSGSGEFWQNSEHSHEIALRLTGQNTRQGRVGVYFSSKSNYRKNSQEFYLLVTVLVNRRWHLKW